MPPPRRRRPVQPATRVRLPRTARPRGTPTAEAPATETAGAETAAVETVVTQTAAVETLATQTRGGQPSATGPATGIEAPADDLSTDPLPGGDLTTAEQPEGEATAAEQPDGDLTAELPAGEAADDERRSSLVLPACLGVLAVILGGLAVWFALAASSVTSGVDTANVALINPAATSQVSQQITNAVNTIFSYNYADTAKTSQAAAAVLTGKAKGEYNTLFKLVRLDAPKEKLVLTTTVTNSGVEYLIGNQARVLIFANQRDTAGSAHKTTDAGAMFAVNAVYQGGRWKIAHIDTFSGAG